MLNNWPFSASKHNCQNCRPALGILGNTEACHWPAAECKTLTLGSLIAASACRSHRQHAIQCSATCATQCDKCQLLAVVTSTPKRTRSTASPWTTQTHRHSHTSSCSHTTERDSLPSLLLASTPAARLAETRLHHHPPCCCSVRPNRLALKPGSAGLT